ncbi:hypothetical protein HJ590_14565 [Naumannella sp. ID2617S]|uniref:Phosphate-binding protein n=1 Tax=Enemella dayhoffiae TaxID=2016507 RepID=A0A255H6J7_9ACTN|nr:substrate-binding domain-containing protein [Enemella dayhoffiae]NNG20760.1 hypothetical protein [Naumannella sp. ID2617S]OYO22813.1 hypothetical protein CGZ93_07155 [Enemella dayhoffiae]
MRIGRWVVGGVVTALALTGCNTATRTDAAPRASASASTPAGLSCPSAMIIGVVPAVQREPIAEVLDGYAKTCRNKGSASIQVKSTDESMLMFRNALATWVAVAQPLPADQLTGFSERCSGEPPRHLPTSAAPLVVSWNLPGVDRLQLTPTVLARMLNGSITRWDDPALKQLNPGVPLPGVPVTAIHPEDSPGLLATVSDWLHTTAPADWPAAASAPWPGKGVPAQNLAAAVSQLGATPGALTVLPQSYARTNSLPAASIDFGAGPVAPGPESATKGLAAASLAEGTDLRVTPKYAGAPAGAYPLNLINYQVVCTNNVAKQGPLLRDLVTYWVMPATQQSLGELGYTPVPEAWAQRIGERAKQLR